KVTGFNPETDSPAQKAGIEIGDVIVSAAGQPVDQTSTLQRIIRGFQPGQTVDIEAMRFGQKKTFHVKLGEPAPDNATVASTEDSGVTTRPTSNNTSTARAADKLGITVEPISPEFAQQTRLQSAYRSGLRIVSVSPQGPSYRNLFTNQIILGELYPKRQDIKSVDDLLAATSSLKSGDVIELRLCNPDPS